MKTIQLKVEGMSCGHCAKTIENALKGIGADGSVDLSGKTVTVTYDENKTGPESIRNAIEDCGYTVAQ